MNNKSKYLMNYLAAEVNNILIDIIHKPIELVNFLGGKIEYSDNKKIPLKTNNSFIIYINKNDINYKMSFYNDLAFLILYNGLLIDKDLWSNTKKINKEIYLRKKDQISYFARALLMPAHSFENILKESTVNTNKYNIVKVAAYFKVGLQEVYKRGIDLEFFE